MAFISVSIDICESTKIKQKFSELSSSEVELNSLYVRFIQMMTLMEVDFYTFLKQESIGVDKVFTIKNIGDEIWYSIYVDEKDDISIIFNNLLKALIRLCEKPIPFVTNDLKLKNKEELDHMKLVPKVYADYIEKYTEVSEIRLNMLHSQLSFLLPDINNNFDKDEYNTLISRLNFGFPEGNGVTHRFDTIGFEVDRFFRATKSALPGIVTIGDHLFKRINIDKKKYRIIEKQLSQEQMKGCNSGYTVHHIINDKQLNINLLNDLQEVYDSTYDETIKLLIKDNYNIKEHYPYL